MKRLLALLLAAAVILPLARADRRDDDHRDDGRRDREHGPRVIVYEHADFRGDFFVLYPGDALENLGRLRFQNGGRLNDAISSIRIEGGAAIEVFEDAYFRGHALGLRVDARNLTWLRFSENRSVSWNDRISSLRVVGPRRPPEPRRIDPDEMIRQVYREVLGRDPRPAELARYRRELEEKKWEARELREELEHSDEYRKRHDHR